MGFFNGLPLESDGTLMNLPCVQLVVILVLPRILHFAFLQRLLQPRLISQIVSGIILGPSWLGQIHGFTDLFFPAPSLPNLQTMSQIGAMLWLFMTGLHLKAELICNHKVASLSLDSHKEGFSGDEWGLSFLLLSWFFAFQPHGSLKL